MITDIQFCLAQRDANGAATTGIEHVASPFSYMVMETQDTLLKDVSRWNPNCFINIWVVRVENVYNNATIPGLDCNFYFGIIKMPPHRGLTVIFILVLQKYHPLQGHLSCDLY